MSNPRLRAARLKLRLDIACVLLVAGMMFSAPFAFFPKSEVIGVLGFLLAFAGLAMGGSLARITRPIAATHLVAALAACMLYLYHQFDTLYIKFLLSLIISFQISIVDRRILMRIRDWVIRYGSRGAALAIVSFVAYFAFQFSPFYRTTLGDGRTLPFFGFTNINFGFDNPEFILFARPAFLFDEPGQFAHFIVLTLALIATARPAVQRWRFETVLLTFSGLATFSLAFLILALIYLSTRLLKLKTWLIIAFLALSAYGLAISGNPLVEALKVRLGDKDSVVVTDDDRVVAGDNRTREITMAWNAFVDDPLWGAGWSNAERTIGHFAASPIGPLGYSGLMALLMYLPLLARMLSSLLAARGFHQTLVVLLVALFFSQRPYFYFPLFILLLEILRHQLVSGAVPAVKPTKTARKRRRHTTDRPARGPEQAPSQQSG